MLSEGEGGKVSFPLLPCIYCHSKSEITIKIVFPKQVLFIPKEYFLVEEEKETLINIRLSSGICYPSNDTKRRSYKSCTSNSTSQWHVVLRVYLKNKKNYPLIHFQTTASQMCRWEWGDSGRALCFHSVPINSGGEIPDCWKPREVCNRFQQNQIAWAVLQATLCPVDPQTAPSLPLLYITEKWHAWSHDTSSTGKPILGCFNLLHLKYKSPTPDLTSCIFKWYHTLLCVTYFGQLWQQSDWSINEAPVSDCVSL